MTIIQYVNDTKWKHKSSWTTIEHCENFNRIVGKFLKTGLKRKKGRGSWHVGWSPLYWKTIQHHKPATSCPSNFLFLSLGRPFICPKPNFSQTAETLFNKITVVLGLFTSAMHFVLRDRRESKKYQILNLAAVITNHLTQP